MLLPLLVTIALGLGSNIAALGFIRGFTLRNSRATPELSDGLSRAEAVLRMAAGFVFFLTAANVASLLLGRAATRSRETSIRVALGASRGRLAWTTVAESLAIAAIGGALSAVLALWTSKVVPALLFEQDAQFLVTAPNLVSVAAASAAGAGILVVCGLLPLVEIRQDRPAAVLKRESSGPSKVSRAVRASLVIGQMSCCCLLVVCSAFLYAGLRAAQQTSVGRRLGESILATVQVHPDVDVDLQYFRNIEQAARSLPGVFETAWSSRLPGSQPARQSFRLEPPGLERREVKMDVAGLTSGSRARFSRPPKAGRLFGLPDRTCRSAVINEEAAELLFGDESVGRSIDDGESMAVEIIGVVAGPSRRSRPTLYYDDTNRPGPPLVGMQRVPFSAPVASKLDRADLDTNAVSPGYFATMGDSLVAGRNFREGAPATGCRVAIVNQQAAAAYFGGNAVGGAAIDGNGRRTTIIGVVRSARLGAFERPAGPAIYFPMVQDSQPVMTLIIGTRTADKRMLEEMRQTLGSLPGRGRAAPTVKTLAEYLSQTALAPLRIAAAIVGTETGIALLLGTIGLYHALSDAARRRRRDLAIRLALGARRHHLVWQVFREGGGLAAAGILVGMTGSLVISQAVSRIAPTVAVPGVWVWIAGPIVLACAAAMAAVFPARRASMIDPLRILRRDN